jgi:hypothetical protein
MNLLRGTGSTPEDRDGGTGTANWLRSWLRDKALDPNDARTARCRGRVRLDTLK